jgi:DNA gyrase/topoisomerase IV subunit A
MFQLVSCEITPECRGVRIAIEVKRSAETQVVLNNLLKHSKLQTRFSANMVALLDHKPRELSLKDMLQHFIDFRLQVLGCIQHGGFIVRVSVRNMPGL